MMTRLLAGLASLVLATTAFAGATITIVNVNAPGIGFNDPTPAAPVGGNAGTTVGEQRLIAFRHAAALWGATLDSRAEIRVQSSFDALSCTATAATLGSAGAIQVFGNFPGAAFQDTWYHVALANKLAGGDLAPGAAGTSADDIRARFNANLGQPGCLTGSGWYYGLDTNHAPNQINLVTVLLHEFAHGLGFSSFASVTTGAYLVGLSDVYSKFYYDNTTGKTRDQMTNAERQASAINPRKVVWTGPKVTANVPAVLAAGTPLARVNTPGSAAGDYAVGEAAFGPALSFPGITADVAIANDAANAGGPSVTDACTAITNPADVAGKIALVDRGTDAGAVAVLVADNVAGGPPAGLGGADPTIAIPSVRITQADGLRIKTALASGAVNATLTVDPTVRAGADRNGRALLYTPNPVIQGSSVSHFDTSASPNQLMEPSINLDLKLAVDTPYDLTRSQLRDVGWYPDADGDLVADDAGDQCLNSDLGPTVVIGGIDTGVPNTFFNNGCSIRDFITKCREGAPNHGAYASCSANVTNALKDAGFITGNQKGAIQSAVGRDK